MLTTVVLVVVFCFFFGGGQLNFSSSRLLNLNRFMKSSYVVWNVMRKRKKIQFVMEHH